MSAATRLKVIETDTLKELETEANDFCASDLVFYVVNMKIYPIVERVGEYEKPTSWVCYIIYKLKNDERGEHGQ